ncbi:hypothetical protein OG535_12485 [Kitasatospora sp. NBC_00085]
MVSGGNGLAYLAICGPLGDLLGVGGSTLVELGAVRPSPYRPRSPRP